MYADFNSGSSGMDSGCSSCATIGDAYDTMPTNVMSQSNQYAQPATMGMAQQTGPAVNSYPSASMVSTPIQQVQANQNTNQQMQNMVRRAVTVNANNNSQMPVQAPPATKEGFINEKAQVPDAPTDRTGYQNSNGVVVANLAGPEERVRRRQNSRVVMFALLALVIMTCLALNETAKYYINRGIQMCEGKQYYYLAYGMVMLVLAVAVFVMFRHHF